MDVNPGFLAPCGLYCGVCGVYYATRDENEKFLQKLLNVYQSGIPQLDELRAGLGNLDYAIYLQELAKLEDIPLMIEHLSTAEEYKLAADHIRNVGRSVGISI